MVLEMDLEEEEVPPLSPKNDKVLPNYAILTEYDSRAFSQKCFRLRLE